MVRKQQKVAVIGTILKKVVKTRKSNLDKKTIGYVHQEQVLKKMLAKSKNTSFGKHFEFGKMLKSGNFVNDFRQTVPIYDYEKMFHEWWHHLLEGKENVTWPGKIKLFGLTSGTSNDSSKRVPLTNDMIKAIRRTGIRQLLVLAEFDLPANFFEKGILAIGGSTNLVKMRDFFEGDLSGILTGRLPFWVNKFYKPGKSISREQNWNVKLQRMVDNAPKWDIGGIAGVPAWVQILLEKIIDQYGLKNIHEMWPNFMAYSHGGVCLTPYKKTFEKLLGKQIIYLETYLASEGFLAYQRNKGRDMQLVLDNGIFFEFIPFDQDTFSPEGNLIGNPNVYLANEVEENKDYAVLISTVSGAWRYLIGDTVKFTSKNNFEIIITGRTKHFLSLCGEHLSVDNMNNAISSVSEELNLGVKEFTVAGIPYENLFAHKWYIGTDQPVDKALLKKKLDDKLKVINDDYRTERSAALKEIIIEVLPEKLFYDWLKSKGKEGGQHKFPRVINDRYYEWEKYVSNYNYRTYT